MTKITTDTISGADAYPRQKCDVELGERSYPIHIGQNLLSDAGKILRDEAKIAVTRRLFIISDEHVARLHAEKLQKSLTSAGYRHELLILPSGESTKSFAQLEKICAWLLGHKIDRQAVGVALGGGVMGDLVGFAAAVTLRGLDFVQIPTSLLAMVDSAVGGKTGINTAQGKNLVGAFHQPQLVLADLNVLKTLPMRELRAGYAECVKHALIDGGGFLPSLEKHGANLFTDADILSYDNVSLLVEVISHSCRTKAEIVGKDEREKLGGRRALLNLGHSFAHAIEGFCQYDGRVLHGEAVAVGLGLAARLSAELGMCRLAVAERIETHLRQVGLPTKLADFKGVSFTTHRLIEIMQNDKKMVNGLLGFILIASKDNSEFNVLQNNQVPPELVQQILQESLGG
ncbi:MAG: 3-dehydroquinate synthase [Alphaproteobacteria bacterium]|nr:3-dehydroquinate synthase [Alphaproteobacteria bacterium]